MAKVLLGLTTYKQNVHRACTFALARAISYAEQVGDALLQYPESGDGAGIAKNRNDLIVEAARRECDAVWFVDADVEVPVSALCRLLEVDTEVVSGLTPLRQLPMVYMVRHATLGIVAPLELVEQDPTGPWLTGASCLLVRRSAWERIPRPWFQWVEESASGGGTSEDLFFARRARATKGVRCVLVPAVKCAHWDGRQRFPPLVEEARDAAAS